MANSRTERNDGTGLGVAEASYGPGGIAPSSVSVPSGDAEPPKSSKPASGTRKRKKHVSRSVSLFLSFFDIDDGNKPSIWEAGDEAQRPMSEHDMEWADYIRNDADVGIITIARYHHSESPFWKYYVKLMLVGTILAQWSIAGAIAYKEIVGYVKFDMGFCANNAPAVTRVQSIAVSVVYVSKMSFLVAKKIKELHHRCPVLNETNKGGKVQLFVALDRFMNLFFEVLVYLMNLFLIYITLDPIEIVFNALAIEFVVQLDNEIKDTYMELYPPEKSAETLDKFQDANNEKGNDAIKGWQFVLVKWINNVNLLSIPFFMVGFFFIFVLSLACKPGADLFDIKD